MKYALFAMMLVAQGCKLSAQQALTTGKPTGSGLNPILTLCNRDQAQCASILGEGKEKTFTWTYEGKEHSSKETVYQMSGFKDIKVEFGPGPNTSDFRGLFDCSATFTKKMARWEDAFKFLGLDTQGVVYEEMGKIAHTVEPGSDKPNKTLLFKHVKNLDKNYMVGIDLSREESTMSIVYIAVSGNSAAGVWNWYWDKR